MPRLPTTPTDIIKLADWLELRALTSRNRIASDGMLQAALNQGSILEPQAPDEPYASQMLEQVTAEVFAELEERARSAGGGYPFRVELPTIVAPRTWSALSSYVFCLCLSYFGWKQQKAATVNPRRIFESLCTGVAGRFVGGEAIRFGSPRTVPSVPKAFIKAIEDLCQSHLVEGDGFRKQPVLSGKDRGVDVVAWRHEVDRRPGKLILFGNCASGTDWKGKLGDLQPKNFCEDWMIEVPVSPILKAFFVPHRIDPRYWKTHTRTAGIIFDRCRLAALSPRLPKTPDFGSGAAWSISQLRAWVG